MLIFRRHCCWYCYKMLNDACTYKILNININGTCNFSVFVWIAGKASTVCESYELAYTKFEK